MFKNYLKITWRNIVKNKTYSAINILGLSLGISMCMLISLFVKDELSFDQNQSHKNEIYRLVVDEKSPAGESFKYGATGMVHGPSFARQVPEIKEFVRTVGEQFNIKKDQDVFTQSAYKVDSNFFNLFDAQFIEGSKNKVISDPYSIVLSEEVAHRFFGKEDALNKVLQIEINNKFENYVVKGVVKKAPLNSSMNLDLIMPFNYNDPPDDQWINFYLNTFFKIKEGTHLAIVEKKIQSIFLTEAKNQLEEAKQKWKYNNSLNFKLQPFLDIHLDRNFKAHSGMKESSNTLLSVFLSGIAIFILIIACINFVNISISHSIIRGKEIGLRKAIGGQRKQLMLQFLSESFLLNFIAFILAVVLTQLALPTFNAVSSKSLSFSYLFDTKLIVLFTSIFLITGLLAGFYPALVLSGYRPVDTLYGRFKLSGKNLLQKSLIVLQFTMASFFIIITLIQYRQVNLFVSKDLGYDDKNVVIVTQDARLQVQSGELFVNELLKEKNIIAVAPRNWGTWNTMAYVNDNQQMGPDMNVVDGRFFDVLKINILDGRGFSKEFGADSTLSVLVNEAFVKEAGWKHAIGQTVKIMNRDPYQVVGVVQDYHFSSLYEKVRPQLFTCNTKYGTYNTFYIKINEPNTPQTLEYIKSVFKKVYPTKPYGYEFLSNINLKQYEKEQQMKKIFLWSALITIVISCMGLFGLSILTVEKRQKEIGIRKVLGATVIQIAQKFSMDFLKLVFLAFAIAVPIAYWAGNTSLHSYPYRIEIGPDLFAVCFLILLFVTLLTVSYQAIRAAMGNPVKSIRMD